MRVIDTHVHVLDPARFPYAPNTIYQPQPHETAPVEQLIAVLDAHGVSHAVVVTPMAGYQSDNAVTLEAVSRYRDRLRGVAVVEANVEPINLESMRTQGIVGIRVDLIGRGTDYLRNEGRRLPGLLRELGLILQIQCEGDQLASNADLLRREAGTVLIDHMGRPNPAENLSQDGFQALLTLAKSPDVYIKLSGPFRFSMAPWPHRDAAPIATAILSVFGLERCVWGSDWPFVRVERRMDYGPMLSLVQHWLPDAGDRHKVLWETPARLFGWNGPV